MNLYALPIHPAANAFPMSDQDTLNTLKDSIECNGLRDPVVVAEVDGELTLIDGRNRLAACKLAGVEPAHVMFAGDEEAIANFVFDKNIARRQLTTSQKAIAEAVLFPEGNHGKRNDLTSLPRNRSKEVGLSTMKRARYIANHAPYLIPEIQQGNLLIKPAYEKCKAEIALKAEIEERRTVLKDEAPELLERVDSGEDLNVVFNEFVRREDEAGKARLAILKVFRDADNILKMFRLEESRKQVLDAVNSRQCSESLAKNFKATVEQMAVNINLLLEDIK